ENPFELKGHLIHRPKVVSSSKASRIQLKAPRTKRLATVSVQLDRESSSQLLCRSNMDTILSALFWMQKILLETFALKKPKPIEGLSIRVNNSTLCYLLYKGGKKRPRDKNVNRLLILKNAMHGMDSAAAPSNANLHYLAEEISNKYKLLHHTRVIL
ncbi:hypothetical protein J6590_010348, partial [Homalodisca vitripennis]